MKYLPTKQLMTVIMSLSITMAVNAKAENFDGPILLNDITIVDGLGHLPYPHRDVLINNGKIVKTSVTSQIGDLPKGTKVIDGTDLTVLPGLIDMHVHIPGVGRRQRPGSDPKILEKALNAALYSGVTTLHDMGNDLNGITKLRDDIAAGKVLGPNISTVGSTIRGLETVTTVDDLSKPEAKAEVKSLLDALQEKDINIIKLYGGLSNWSARHIMTEAKKRGMKGVADFWCTNLSLTGFKVTLVDGWAHGGCWEILPGAAEWMRDNDKFAITNLVLFDSMGGHSSFKDYDVKGYYKNDLVKAPYGKGFVKQYYDSFLQTREAFAEGEHSLYHAQLFGELGNLLPVNQVNAKLIHDADVLDALGTDAGFARGVFIGESMHTEMKLQVEAGISALEVIKMGTHNAAKIIGWEDKVGSIESGMMADVFIVSGKPWENISATRNIKYVIKGGTLLDRKSLRAK